MTVQEGVSAVATGFFLAHVFDRIIPVSWGRIARLVAAIELFFAFFILMAIFGEVTLW